MSYVAEGADARIGVCVGRRSDKYRVGQPGIDPRVVTPPAAAPTAATGASGNVTSTGLKFRYTWVVGGLETSPSPASGAVTPAADQVDLTGVADCADSRCTEKRIYGSEDDFVTEFWAGSIYDNSTTTYTFDVALTSDALDWSLRAPSANETGLNHGMQFVNPQSVTLEADYTKAKTNEINGGQNHLAMVTVAGQIQNPLRNGMSIPMLIAAFGSPTVSRPAAGVVRYRWLASVAKALQRGVDFLIYYGAGHIPEFFWNVFVPQVQVGIQGGQLATHQATLMGSHHTPHGVAEIVSGTWTGTVLVRGRRGDLRKDTSDVYLKVTTGASGGAAAFKTKVGSGASYSGSAYTLTYNTTSKRQTQGASQVSDWITIHNESGGFLGLRKSGFEAPLQVCFIGDLSTLPLNLEVKIPRKARIPHELGDTLLSNGDFASGDLTGWTGTNWAYSSGKAAHTAGATAALTQAVTVAIGVTYRVAFTVSNRTAGTVTPALGATTGTARSTDATYTEELVAAADGSVNFTLTPTTDFDGKVDDIWVQAVADPNTLNLWTGCPEHMVRSSVFGASQAVLKKDGSVIRFYNASLQIGQPRRKETYPGPEAAFATDITPDGEPTAQWTLSRPYDEDAATWKQISAECDKVALELLFQGVDIYSQPGVLSGYQETLSIKTNQNIVTQVNAPIPNDKALPQQITAQMERPDDSSTEWYEINVYTAARTEWQVT